jgi:hypothetical protein
MTNPIFISFYSDNPYYIDKAIALERKCSDLGISIEMDKINLYKEYWKNTLYKPTFIFNKIREKKEDLVWVDVDTDIRIYHTCFRKWESDILAASHTGNLDGIKASPLCFKYNERTLSFLSEWSSICLAKIGSNDVDLDHDVFKYEILPNYKNRLSISIMGGDLNSRDFSDGSVIMNGISRMYEKSSQIKTVLNKNKDRKEKFNELSLCDFTIKNRYE